jgi:hypothetical protein
VLLEGPAPPAYGNKTCLVEARNALTAWTTHENERGRDAAADVGRALALTVQAVGLD